MVIHCGILQQEFWHGINGDTVKMALHRVQEDIFNGGDQNGLINKQYWCVPCLWVITRYSSVYSSNILMSRFTVMPKYIYVAFVIMYYK